MFQIDRPLLTLAVIAVALCAGAAARQKRRVLVGVPSGPANHRNVSSALGRAAYADVLVRAARVDGESLREQARLVVRLAPAESPGAVLAVAADNTCDKIYYASEVVTARAWSRGVQILGPDRADLDAASTLKSIKGELAGWEVELEFASGTYLRVYAHAWSSSDDDLARLQTRLEGRVRSTTARRADCRPALGPAAATAQRRLHSQAR